MCGFPSQNGFALVTVLLLASLLMFLLIGMLFMTSEEEMRSSSYLEGERGNMLLDIALAEVQAKLMDGGEIPYKDGVATASMTACPGLLEVRRYDVLPNRGYQVGREAFMDEKSFFRKPFAREYERGGQGDWQPANPQWIALYSQKWYAPLCRYMTVKGNQVREENPDYNPERVFNLNTVGNPFYPGSLYLGGISGENVGIKNASLKGKPATRGKEKKYSYLPGESSVERPLYIQWIPLYEDARYGAVLPSGKRNVIIGRYAYWVDVENTKININQIKREWQQTALGKLTGRSDAQRGEGSYFAQWGEKEKETPRYGMEYYKPNTYKLFQDKVPASYGVKLYYRTNYGRLLEERGSNYATEEYEKKIFAQERGEFPPVIADTATIDASSFWGLRPYRIKPKDTVWLERVNIVGEYNLFEETHAVLDPQVEKQRAELREVSLRGLEKMYGQGMTLYGWDEERDPLGRAKLDINAILREGDALFDQGEGLPQSDHRGTTLQQFLARTEDPKYYAAYYPQAYPHRGANLSYLDGMKVMAGRGADAERYARAMRDQMVTNIIEYGRPHEDPPFMDTDRGIVGAKSMPYVAEVAIRARNALWTLWDYEKMLPYQPDPTQRYIRLDYPWDNPFSVFPGFDENELVYRDDFKKTKELAGSDFSFAQHLADAFFYTFIPSFPFNPTVTVAGNIPGSYRKVLPLYQGTSFDLSNHYYILNELFNHVVIDVTLAVVNPDPFGKEKDSEWEIELDYSWLDGTRGYWSDYEATIPALFGSLNPAFSGARGKRKNTVKAILDKGQYTPHLLTGSGENVDQLGYFFEVNKQAPQTTVHFRLLWPKGNGNKIETGTILGDTIDGFPENHENGKWLGNVLQSFRIWGWRIYRKDKRYPGRRALYHQVPLRHPGQGSEPRPFWQMTVDPDGEGPKPPPNAGVLASSRMSSYGLEVDKKIHYPDVHALEHFRSPTRQLIANLADANEGDVALPFGLGSRKSSTSREEWNILRERKNVSASWFASDTIAEFARLAESLMATIPPGPGEDRDLIVSEYKSEPTLFAPFNFSAPDDPRYFYHLEQALVEQEGEPPFRGLEGKLYMPTRIIRKLGTLLGAATEDFKNKAHSDLLRFLLLQLKLRDEGYHHREVIRKNGRSRASSGRRGSDGFVQGMALVERLVCIDPVLGHRTGNPDLKIERDGQTFSGHFYGRNGHPWRRYNYFFHHYDKDTNSPQAEILGNQRRPEPDRCLTQFLNDPRRVDGKSEPQYEEKKVSVTWGDPSVAEITYDYHYSAFNKREIPTRALTGSVLMNALLIKGTDFPDLQSEKGWSQVTEIEEDDVEVWPYGQGMDVSYGYKQKEFANARMRFRNGSFVTHSPRGGPMISIGEIGLCHSGFLQRAIDLDRPPLYTAPGIKRLGAPQYGPPSNMLLDLLVSSNFRDERGRYLSREDWEKGRYHPHSPTNPRVGVWNINGKIAHDHYLAIHEDRDTVEEVVHPLLVPNAVKKATPSLQVVGNDGGMDPYLSPFIRFRRGWEHWLGAIGGDYTEHRNLGSGGVWNKKGGGESPYAIAQGVNDFSWYPRKTRKRTKRTDFYVNFGSRDRIEEGANLLLLGSSTTEEILGDLMSQGERSLKKKGSFYPLKSGDIRSLYDVKRYGLFPLFHHISEVGYTGLGGIHTALNHRSATTPAHGGFEYEEELVDVEAGGDGILGALSQAGFARNAPWVMAANQASTSANVFTVHIVTQSLRDNGGVRSKKPGSRIANGIGYMDKEDEVLGEHWAQVTIARIPHRDRWGKILTDKEGAPHYSYKIIQRRVRKNIN